MTGPLSGLLVIALEQAVAAPLCTARLAEAGARVIKVERPEGDFARGYDNVVEGESSYFVWLNRGKESIALNLKDPGDVAVLEAMLSQADVLVQNFSPGATERLGFGSSELRRRYPRLITCDITGYGDEGIWARMKAYDFLIQCEAGLASITGGPNEPSRVGISVADIACGSNAHAAVLQALYDRERSGLGSGVSVSLFDSLADWMTVPLLHWDYGGKAPARVGLKHPSIAPYGAFRTGDGREIVIAIQNEREWANLCEKALLRPDLVQDPRFASNVDRVENRAELDRTIQEILVGLTAEEAAEQLAAANIAYGAVNSVEEFSQHPQLRRVSALIGESMVKLPAMPWRWHDRAEPAPASLPKIDEHGAALRQEFGWTATAAAAGR